MEKLTAEERIRKAQETYYRRKNREDNNSYLNARRPKKRYKFLIILFLLTLAYCYFNKNQINEWLAKFENFDEKFATFKEYLGNSFTQLNIKETSTNEKSQMEIDAEYINNNYSLVIPTEGEVTSGFGDREEDGKMQFHQGIDISAQEGTEIYSVMQGNVIVSAFSEEYGNYIKIQEGNITTIYTHLSELSVETGDTVVQNQVIGKVGSTRKYNLLAFAF